jgi:transcriptional regulator with XRE-family HTH domain
LKINVEVAKMAMTALERKALFKSVVTLRELTMAEAAARLGVSYNHLMLVLRGDRVGSERLEQQIAEFVNCPVRDLFRRRTRGTAA